MHKSAVLPMLLAIVLALSGCAQLARERVEIDKLFITRIFSIDIAPEDKIKITITTKNLSTGGGAQQATQMGESIYSEGNTVFDASRNLLIYSDRRPNYGHTEFIILGEEIARKGILPYLDYFSRENEFRYNAKLYIVKGGTANSVVKKSTTSRMFVGDRIMSIEENIQNTSLSSIVSLNEAMIIFDNKNLDTFIPYIELVDTMTSEEKKDIYDILLRGYAIFKRDKLLYFTSEEEARGINWIMGRIGSGIILIKNEAGEEISMEIVDSKVKLIPRVEGNKLSCTVEISFTTNIGEVLGTQNVIEHDTIGYLTEQQEKAVKKEVENAIRIAQENNSDHFSTLSKFILKYPMMRDYLRKNWKSLYPGINFNVAVESRIKGTYLINEPTGSSEGAAGE